MPVRYSITLPLLGLILAACIPRMALLASSIARRAAASQRSSGVPIVSITLATLFVLRVVFFDVAAVLASALEPKDKLPDINKDCYAAEQDYMPINLGGYKSTQGLRLTTIQALRFFQNEYLKSDRTYLIVVLMLSKIHQLLDYPSTAIRIFFFYHLKSKRGSNFFASAYLRLCIIKIFC
jgi:hypothetical protein